MLGLPRGEVILSPWSEEWEKEFLLEKEKIQKKISKYIVDIHHIGSTSVHYLSAKSIIDIAIEIKKFSEGELCIKDLEDLGYHIEGQIFCLIDIILIKANLELIKFI